MTAALFDANLAAQEKIINIPLVKRQVSRGKILVENSKASNREFQMINECLQSCIKSQQSHIPLNKKVTVSDDDIDDEGSDILSHNIHPLTASAVALQVTEEEMLKKYNREKHSRVIENRLQSSKSKYDRTLQSVESFAETKAELQKTLTKMESRKERNKFITTLNQFEEHLDKLATIDDALENRTAKILEIYDN